MLHKALREGKGNEKTRVFLVSLSAVIFTNLAHTLWHVFGSVAKTGQVHKEGPFSAETEKQLN